MPRISSSQLIASGLALALLFLTVTAAVAWVAPADSGYFVEALTIDAVAATMAIAAWSGILRRTRGRLESWSDWLGAFVVGLVASVAFLALDCDALPVIHPEFVCKGNPGISVVFTLGAVCLTAIALPSALRAWLLALLERQAETGRASI